MEAVWPRRLLRSWIRTESRRELRARLNRIRAWGRRHYCPVCDARLRAFLSDHRTGRAGAECPVCGSMERHRSIWPFLVNETPLRSAALRVLDPALGFPADLERTVEDPAVSTPEHRRRVYGHPGHQRLFGRDLERRLGEAGFTVRRIPYGREPSRAETQRRGIYPHYPIYSCSKE